MAININNYDQTGLLQQNTASAWIHWEFSKFPDKFSINVEYRIDHISKNKNEIKKTHELKNPFQNISHLLERFVLRQF